MFLSRLDNQGWAKTWLGPDLKVRAGPRLGPGPPTRPADSGFFFWAPFRNFFLQVFRRMSRKKSSRIVDPADPTKFVAFPGNSTNNVDKNPDLAFLAKPAGLVGDDLAIL